MNKYKILRNGFLVATTDDAESAIAFATTAEAPREISILELGEDGRYHPYKYI